MLRIITLNLNGIRSAARKGFFGWLGRTRADIVCVQELKAQPGDIGREVARIGRLRGHFHCAEKKGYSGVGIYTRHEPTKIVEGIGISDIDRESVELIDASGAALAGVVIALDRLEKGDTLRPPPAPWLRKLQMKLGRL